MKIYLYDEQILLYITMFIHMASDHLKRRSRDHADPILTADSNFACLQIRMQQTSSFLRMN